MEGWLVPLGLFAMIAVVVAASVWGGVQNKRALHDTVRRAIEAGQKLDVETISALQRPLRGARQDVRGGVIMATLAVGFVAAGVLMQMSGGGAHEFAAGKGLYAAAAIVGAIGVGHLIAGLMLRGPKDGA